MTTLTTVATPAHVRSTAPTSKPTISGQAHDTPQHTKQEMSGGNQQGSLPTRYLSTSAGTTTTTTPAHVDDQAGDSIDVVPAEVQVSPPRARVRV